MSGVSGQQQWMFRPKHGLGRVPMDVWPKGTRRVDHLVLGRLPYSALIAEDVEDNQPTADNPPQRGAATQPAALGKSRLRVYRRGSLANRAALICDNGARGEQWSVVSTVG